MKQYTATFSTGQTVTRNSDNEYCVAVAYVNRVTGELKNVSFSSNKNAKASSTGIFGKVERRWFANKPAYLKALDEDKQARATWQHETVLI